MQTNALARVEPLIAPPVVLTKLLRVLSIPDVNLQEVVSLVTLEPGLTAKVLQLCNSAFFASTSRTADIFQAVQKVGIQSLRQIVVTIMYERSMSAVKREWGFDARQLWKHSIFAGFAAEMLAADFSADRSSLFTAGLLHDFGKLVFAVAFEGRYGDLVANAKGNQEALLQREQEVFNVDHAELG